MDRIPSRPPAAAVLCCLVATLLFPGFPAARAQQPPEDRVLHMVVDSHYGDDDLAMAFSPNCLSGGPPNFDTRNQDPTACGGGVQWWPVDHTPQTGGGTQSCCQDLPQEVLLYVPWPFRTINGGPEAGAGTGIGTKGAIPYLRGFGNDPSQPDCIGFPPGPPPVLPMGSYVSPCTNKTWTYTIIHLMPGWYGRTNQSGSTFRYDHNGLWSNGENFPIRLPDGVSIQGASALNVVFDLHDPDDVQGRGKGPAFAFGTPVGFPAPYSSNGNDSFIDSVSIFGGFRPNDPSSQNPFASSGIYITQDVHGEDPVRPTITNCFLFGNGVGILVDTPVGFENAMIEATIVNNTIAWNGIGLWNGQLPALPNFDSIGHARLNLINNIFDSVAADPALSGSAPQGYPPHWPYMGGFSPRPVCFEGVEDEDLLVEAPAGGPLRDFNAYEANLLPPPNADKYNTQQTFTWIPNLPRTFNRGWFPGNTGSPPAPGVDIRPITDGGNPAANRGILYVRDLLLAGSLPGSGGPYGGRTDFDLSPGDFRLSPLALNAWTSSAPAAPDRLNPCIDAGWSVWPATMQRQGASVSVEVPGRLAKVGPPPAGNGTWTFDYTKNDCEGYGNQRIQRYFPYYGGFNCPSEPELCLQIDLGADEVTGNLAIGFRFGTTSFFRDRDLEFQPPFPRYDNGYIWWIGPSKAVVGTDPPRPNLRPDYTWWWPNPFINPPRCWHYRWYGDSLHPCGPIPYYQPVSVDITPHLLPDMHPWWMHPSAHPGFPSNPVWQCWRFCASLPAVNPFLYEHPVAGVANPPGTWLGPYTDPNTNLTYNYLDGTPIPLPGLPPIPAQTFGPWAGPGGAPTPPNRIGSFTAWLNAAEGAGGAGNQGPDDVVGISDVHRYSVEFGDLDPWNMPTNVQSFTVWHRQP